MEGLNQKEYPGISPVQLVEMLEAKRLRLFHKEVTVYSFRPALLMPLPPQINHEYPDLCAEFSFIQQGWEEWDAGKRNFGPIS